MGAVRAAEDPALRLDPVTDHSTAAVLARGRHGLDGALEGIEDAASALLHDLHGPLVLVATDIAARHCRLLLRVEALMSHHRPRGRALSPHRAASATFRRPTAASSSR